MKLTLKDGAFVEFDSVSQLVEFYKQLSPTTTNNGNHKTRVSTRNNRVDRELDEMPESPLKLVKFLFGATGAVDSDAVVKTLGISGRAIGGTVTSLGFWAKRHNLEKKQMLVKGRRANGNGRSVRTLALTESFRKMIREGKVPGVKLDT